MRRIQKALLPLLVSCILFTGCESTNHENTEVLSTESDAVCFTDSLGKSVTVDAPKKVAVLSGSLADAWQLAGGTIAAATDDAWDIEDLTLSEDIISVGSLKSFDVESIITNDIDFCILTANLADQVGFRDTLEAAGITTAYFEVETFDDYVSMMKIFTDITGRSDLYTKNVADIQEQINLAIARADDSHPTVLFLRTYSSGVKAKNSESMTGSMLKDLGCINIADSDTSFLDNLSIEAMIEADPDYIFVTTMGDSTDDAMKSLSEMFTSNPAWESLSAVQNGHYYVLPKDLFQNKPNERWGESYQQLADILYGDAND